MTDRENIVLVTGCAGFIGSNLCDALLEAGYNVIGIDNLSTGHIKHLTQALKYDTFTFIQEDIRNHESLEKIFNTYSITHVSHQAARGSVPKSVDNPLLTNEINVNGTLNLLRLAKTHNIEKFVCAISSSIYGNTPTLPKIETMPYHPESPYAITKTAKEMYCKVFYSLYGLPTIGLRYFNVYGRRQDPQGDYAAVIPRWILAGTNNENLPLNGNGKQTRDFTYIDDVIHANKQALFKNNAEAYGKGYNICYGEQTAIKDIGTYIIKNTEASSSIVTAPARSGDINDSLGDRELAKELLGYTPTTSIYTGLAKTIERYKNNPNYFTSNT